MRILLYGGSFNPPHNGHVDAVRAAREYLRPDRLLIMPGYLPPHKDLAAGSPDAAERRELARRAFSCFPEAEVSDLELKRGGVSYSVDTLEELKALWPDSEIVFLMGADMFLYMEKWYRFERILELCSLAALPREEAQQGELEEFAGKLRREHNARVFVIPKEPLPMASTDVRELLPRRAGREMLPESVYEEIIRLRLYGAQPELAWLRERAYAFLKPTRIAHVRGCERLAVKLAVRWGEDADRAAEAAILHDITKKFSSEEQLRLCDKYGIMTDIAERQETQLLHAKTGAAMARELFGVDEAVYQAILWHTTGRAGMSTLEKIIYLADAAEETRQYEGVEALRALALSDLDEAMIHALQMSQNTILSRGRVPHVRTKEALDWLLDSRDML